MEDAAMLPIRPAAVFFALTLASASLAQAPPIAEWSFQEGASEWNSLDPAGRISVTSDANVVREDGGSCLEFAYTPKEGVISGAVTPVTSGLAGAHSVRFWIKTSEYAFATVVLAETDGSAYIAPFSSLPGTWQEVALGFGEFAPMDNTQDGNGRVDPAQIGAVGFGDVIFLLDTLARQLPFIPAPDLGPRLLWLDDVKIQAEPVPPRWEVTQIDGARAVRLDSFEGAPLQWLTLCGSGIELAYDNEHHTDGDYSLRATYNLPTGKVFGLMTPPGDAPLAGTKTLRMSVMSEAPVVLLVELKERDESKYHGTAQIVGEGKFVDVRIRLADFKLADDSTDENDKLDMDQVKELLIADISAAAGAPATANTLWFDNVIFSD
jgi:hypothetical protein